MRVYKCPLCPGYHLTSKEPKPDPAIESNRKAVDEVRPLLAQHLSASKMAEATGLSLPMVHRAVAFIRRAEARRARADRIEGKP